MSTSATASLYIHANDTHENFRLATAPLDRARRMDDADRRVGRVLPDRLRPVPRLLRGRGPARRARSDRGALLRRSRRGSSRSRSPRRATPPGWATIPNGRSTRCGCRYESMVSPATVYDYHVAERAARSCSRCRKSPRATTPRSTAPSGWRSPRATARRSRSAWSCTARTAPTAGPLHLYGYGAYGIAIEPGFSTTRLSLVDRGFAYAIAHIRGGDDLGRAWYKAGKLERRTNTFNDFVDVAQGPDRARLYRGGPDQRSRAARPAAS